MLLLVFVYPVRMVFAALFNFLSNGWLPAGFAITEVAQLPVLFITFAVAFGSMGAVMWALYLRAWRFRERLELDARERLWTRLCLWNWGLVPVVAMVSITLALTIPATRESGWLLGLPGFVFFVLHLSELFLRRRLGKQLKALEAP